MKLTEDNFDIGRVGEWEDSHSYFVGIQWLKSEKEGELIRDEILQNQEIVERLKKT